jgi:hypothetical protein
MEIKDKKIKDAIVNKVLIEIGESIYETNSSKSGVVCIKTKQTSKDLCINNSKKRSEQHQKHLKITLVKNKRSHSSTSADLLRVLRITILITPLWKG